MTLYIFPGYEYLVFDGDIKGSRYSIDSQWFFTGMGKFLPYAEALVNYSSASDGDIRKAEGLGYRFGIGISWNFDH